MEEKFTEIVPECDECDILGAEVERLNAELEKKPEKEKTNGRPRPFKRFFEWLLGPLIYDGEETCGHCKYWKNRHPKGLEWENYNGKKKYALGDCKLTVGKHDTTYKDSCHRFTPRRRYMRRIVPWKSEA